MYVIQTDQLTKRFGETIAVDNVSVNVQEGEIYGFLGLNGAGKTTAIRLLLGMIQSDSGSISLFNQKPKQASGIWNQVGYMVETPYSYPNLTVKENLEIVYQLRGLSDRRQIDNIISILHLDPYKNRKARHLSLGNNQRLGLAKALLHNPKLLILDEPINGLDPAGIVEVREYFKELVKNYNTTIFLSSHILSEVSKVATRIGIVNQGKLIKEINTDELEQQILKKIRVDTNDNPKALHILNDNEFNGFIDEDGFIQSKDLKALEHPEEIATLLVRADLPPKMLTIFEEDLEAYFLRMINN